MTEEVMMFGKVSMALVGLAAMVLLLVAIAPAANGGSSSKDERPVLKITGPKTVTAGSVATFKVRLTAKQDVFQDQLVSVSVFVDGVQMPLKMPHGFELLMGPPAVGYWFLDSPKVGNHDQTIKVAVPKISTGQQFCLAVSTKDAPQTLYGAFTPPTDSYCVGYTR